MSNPLTADELASLLPTEEVTIREIGVGDLLVTEHGVLLIAKIVVEDDGSVGLLDRWNSGGFYRKDKLDVWTERRIRRRCVLKTKIKEALAQTE